MNQTINDLVHQARMITNDEVAYFSRVHNRVLDLAEVTDIYNEKFALLIVQRCVTQIEKNYVAMVGTYPGANNSAVRKCVVTVNEHFGVKL